MSLARAITKRAKRINDMQLPGRHATVKHGAVINRNMISLPTELISTTNVQALNAPDIRSVSAASSGSSISSANDSDFSTIDRSFLSNAGTDTSSIESSPITPATPPMDDAKAFFGSKYQYQYQYQYEGASDLTSDACPEVPTIPQRAPSHSKHAHVELSRKRSIQRMSPPPTVISYQPAIRNHDDDYQAVSDQSHPFGRELAQVHEVAEEFGASTALLDEEEQEILSKGLCKFGVDDYINEICGMYGGVYEGRLGPMANPWV